MESLLTAEEARKLTTKEIQCYTETVAKIKKAALDGRSATFIHTLLLLPAVCDRLKADGFIVNEPHESGPARGWVSWRDVDG